MSKPMLWVPLGVFYVVLAVGIVHFEGKSHREGLRDRKREQLQTLASADESKPDSVEPKADEKPSEPPPVVEEIKPPEPPIVQKEAPAPEPKPLIVPAEKPPPKTKSPSPKAVARADVPKPAPDVPKKRQSAISLPPEVIPNLAELSAAEELVLGKKLHEIIVANHHEDQGKWGKYLQLVSAAVKPLIDMRSRKDIPITITILDTPEVTAFSHLGGFIYMGRGIFTLAATEPEYQFLVGREIAHIDRKDGQKAVAEAMKAGPAAGIGTIQYLYHQIALGDGEARENEADIWAVDHMRRLDKTDRACLSFLRKLEAASKDPEHDFRNGGITPTTELTDTVQDIGNNMLALPAAWKRLQNVKDRLKLLSGAGDPKRK